MRQTVNPQFSYQSSVVKNGEMEYSFQISQGSAFEEVKSPSLEESLPKTQDKLFIGGISLHVNIQDLEGRIQMAAGLSEPITISMVDRTDSNSFSGYGFITVSNPADRSKLLTMKTFKYKKCWIGIKPFLTNKTDIRKLKNQKADRKLHIKGITQRIQEKDLEQYFSHFGEINHIQINKSQITGHYKGFAFIEFTEKQAVDRVIANPYHTVKEVCLICEKSRVKNTDVPVIYGDQDKDFNQGTRNSLSFIKPIVYRSSIPKASFIRVAANHTNNNINFNLRSLRPRAGLMILQNRQISGHNNQSAIQSLAPVSILRI